MLLKRYEMPFTLRDLVVMTDKQKYKQFSTMIAYSLKMKMNKKTTQKFKWKCGEIEGIGTQFWGVLREI